MYCGNCGKIVGAHDRHCGSCGAATGAQPSVEKVREAIKTAEKEAPTEHNQRRGRPRAGKSLIWIGILVVVGIVYGPVSDRLTISSADPAMLKLASDAGMSQEGELLFLRAKPQLDSDSQMESDCASNAAANNQNGFIEQGCYDPTANRIYLRKMSAGLYPLEVATAAYEMLHIAYVNIYKAGSGDRLDRSIESNYKSVNDPQLTAQVTSFAKTEPNARDLELFSLLGTGYSTLDTTLSSYYSPYFTDIGLDVSDNGQVASLFNSDLTQLNTLKSSIDSLTAQAKTEYQDAQTAYSDSVGWANQGNAYENNYDYNIYSSDLKESNDSIATSNGDVDKYNALLEQYNALVTEYNGTQPISQIQSGTQAQSSPDQ